MSQDYGKAGTLAVLTPQANTTVEPEMWSLLPAGWSLLNARLTSDCSTIEERLIDYADSLTSSAGQFANAPVDVLAFACTGASYLIGADREQRIIDEVQSRYRIPCVTAARATVSTLRAFGAQTVALLSPYPESLNSRSASYWQAHGFSIIKSSGPALQQNAFHPIYAMSAEAVYQSYQSLSKTHADVVLMLGTGMPTLASILRGNRQQLKPAISCNLALTRAAIEATRSIDMSADNMQIDDWLAGVHWRERFHMIAGDL